MGELLEGVVDGLSSALEDEGLGRAVAQEDLEVAGQGGGIVVDLVQLLGVAAGADLGGGGGTIGGVVVWWCGGDLEFDLGLVVVIQHHHHQTGKRGGLGERRGGDRPGSRARRLC